MLAYSFSETELDSLEDSGTKTFSKSPWRRDIGFSLIRNLDLDIGHSNFSIESPKEGNKSNTARRFCDFNKKASVCDLSSLYYKLDFTVYFSLEKWAEKRFNYSFLRETEFFLGGAFISSLKSGICLRRKGYGNFKGYIQCGIGDIKGGWTMPVYKKDPFFSYFTFSTIVWALSQESKDVSLRSSLSASLSLLYFIKKQEKWSWAFSSNHSLTYNHFSDPVPKQAKLAYNNPFDTNQQLSLILKQNFNKYLPANTSLFVLYSLAIDTYKTYWHRRHIENSNRESILKDLDKCDSRSKLGSVITCGNRWQHLSLGVSSSWRLAQKTYMRFSVNWKDSLFLHNPIHEKVGLKRTPSLDLQNWYFNLRISYSF